jgi:hypothetical protein
MDNEREIKTDSQLPKQIKRVSFHSWPIDERGIMYCGTLGKKKSGLVKEIVVVVAAE